MDAVDTGDAHLDALEAEADAERRRQNADLWERYDAYLDSPAWAHRRQLVLRRAGGICEGCGTEPAREVHHLTYQRVGHEMLFDLVAVCADCHRAIHPDRFAA